MTYIAASRDALAKALCPPHHHEGWASSVTKADGTHEFKSGPRKPCALHQGQADALIASGAVIDAATLADDEALHWRLLDWCVTHDVEEPGIEGSGVRHVLRALAAALTERAQ